ncbi:MAG: ribonuclease H-like domain-containing protein [Tissierellia bacterium]|nr:ribonuclease H-like domain-containing protein [Tissierellia bacterium]
MDIIKKELPPKYKKVIKEGQIYLTIKTTGLQKVKNSIYGIGYAYLEDGKPKYTILNSLLVHEEYILIQKFIEDTKDSNIITTYYGNTFDLPFLVEKMEIYDFTLPPHYEDDMYILVKTLKDELKLKSMSKKHIGDFFQIAEPPLDGKKEIQLYKQALTNKSESKLNIELIENTRKSLFLLLELKHRILPLEEEYLILKKDPFYRINHCKIQGDYLQIKGFTTDEKKEIYHQSITLKTNKESESFFLEFPVKSAPYDKERRCYYTLDQKLINYSSIPFPKEVYPLKLGKIYILKNIKEIAETYLKELL